MPRPIGLSATTDQPPRLLAWCYFLTFFVLGLAPAALGPTLLALAEQTGSELGDISILFSMRSLGYLCSARIIGGMYDKHNGHPIMAGALSLVVVLFATLPYIASLGVLSGAFLIHGILSACIDLGGNILLIWAYQRNTASYVNGLHFSFGLGAFTAPLIVAMTLTVQMPAVYTYWIIAVLGIPSIIWLLRSPSPNNPLVQENDTPAAASKAIPVWLLAGFFFLYGGSEVSLGGWIHTYGIKHNLMDEKTAALLTSCFWGAFTLGRLLAIRLSSKFASAKLVLLQLTGAALCVLVLLLSPANNLLTWTCTLLTGLCMSSVFPLAITYFKRFTAGSGQMSSWFWIGASAGSMTIPWTIGQYFDSIGPTFFTLLIVICLTMAIGIMFYISRFLYSDTD